MYSRCQVQGNAAKKDYDNRSFLLAQAGLRTASSGFTLRNRNGEFDIYKIPLSPAAQRRS